MAYEKDITKEVVVADNLSGFIANLSSALKTQLTIRDNQDELNFQKLVPNMTLDQQLAYRKAQLGRVSDNPDSKAQVQSEITSLEQRVAAQKYNNDYTQKLIDSETDVSSLDSFISWMRDKLSSTTDPTTIATIQSELNTQENNRFNLSQQALKDQTTFALNDKTASVIKSQIDRVANAKNKADLAQDDQTSAALDLQLQQLNQALASSGIETSLRNFSVATITGASSATGLLDAMNSQIASAVSTGPVTVGGVTYDSAKEFWTYKRDSYIADNSSSGFIPRLTQEGKDLLATKNIQGIVSPNDITSQNSIFTNVAARPELQNFAAQLNNAKADVGQSAADLMSKAITDQFQQDFDVNKAVNALSAIQATGVNVSDAFTKILNSNAATKEKAVQNILDSAKSIISANPGIAPGDALNEAIKSGAGVVLSPQQLSNESATKIVTDESKNAAAGTYKEDTRTTIAPPVTPPTSTAPNVPLPSTTPTTKLPPAASGPTPTATPQNTLKAYKADGSIVYVQPGTYNQGISLTPPAHAPAQPTSNTTPAPASPTPTPSVTPTATPQFIPPTPSPTVSTPKPAPAPSQQTYKVSAGDTLSAIAKKYYGDATQYQKIAKANNIANPNQISVGQSLIIPT